MYDDMAEEHPRRPPPHGPLDPLTKRAHACCSQHNMAATPRRTSTPLRGSVGGALASSASRAQGKSDATPLSFLEEAALPMLVEETAALQENLAHMADMQQSLTTFNESFAMFLYGIRMNAFCVEWPEAPTDADLAAAAARPADTPTAEPAWPAQADETYCTDVSAEATPRARARSFTSRAADRAPAPRPSAAAERGRAAGHAQAAGRPSTAHHRASTAAPSSSAPRSSAAPRASTAPGTASLRTTTSEQPPARRAAMASSRSASTTRTEPGARDSLRTTRTTRPAAASAPPKRVPPALQRRRIVRGPHSPRRLPTT